MYTQLPDESRREVTRSQQNKSRAGKRVGYPSLTECSVQSVLARTILRERHPG